MVRAGSDERRASTLRTRIVRAFAAFAVVVAIFFGVSTAVFLYTVEDEFFNAMLGEEAALLESQRASGADWGVPRTSWMSVHTSTESLPADLRSQLRAEPTRTEFVGENGRHYHVRPLRGRAGATAAREGARALIAPAWLVAEVSRRLIVRPMRSALIEKWLIVECFILVLAVLIALRMARRVAQPLASLAEGVQDFDPSLPTGTAVMVNADAEVLVVAKALDEMRARVQALVARERTFTRDVSHELRTPLAVIRSTAAQALRDDGMRSDSRRLLTMALNAAEQMERTVTSLLTLARDDLLVGPAMPTRILPTLEQVVVEQSLVISGRDISLDLRVPAQAALHVSETVLHMLLSNLLGNAFAHTASGNIRMTFVDGILRISNPVDDDHNERVVPKLDTLAVPGVRRDHSPGYGFGLDIVARLCARAGLALHWQRREGVFDVWVYEHTHRSRSRA
ncbi:HAMP domain-containing sensor histidine kinase [Gemmatimonas sp.]|uniref:sensor histidine kinase n=1 Tax=Gemmatimonas sp. TaxID=1962908 RepID=UPI00286E5041|nr:HAMP domain-containing sensor histidine kinase [Gemmatimonas sp.]